LDRNDPDGAAANGAPEYGRTRLLGGDVEDPHGWGKIEGMILGQ